MIFQCPFHPQYKAVKRPRVDCWFCQTMFDWAESMKHRGKGLKGTATSVYKSRLREGRYEYEIAPGHWVSRQRIYQLRKQQSHRIIHRTQVGL
jgi:hypothetical protein